MRRYTRAFVAAVGLAGLWVAAPKAGQDSTRAIVPEAFLGARPAAGTPSGPAPVYKQATPSRAAAGGTMVELGVTLWRLRPARQSDPTRLLLHDPGQAQAWIPERVRLDESLKTGDRLRLSIESPREGYLYVIDAESFADRTRSEPYLIFPTSRLRGGANKVSAGRLIDIPDQADAPPFFTLKPSRADSTGEQLTILVAREPLTDVTVGPSSIKLGRDRVAEWEKRGGMNIERFEMESGAGKTWSAAEQGAAADGTRTLTRADPPPQTLLRIRATDPGFIAVPIQLGRK